MNVTGMLSQAIRKNSKDFFNVVPFDKSKDRLLRMDFTATNTELSKAIVNNVDLFSEYVNEKLKSNNCRYGIGGYNEDRVLYKYFKQFETEKNEEPRSVHLGFDIWGEAGTPVYAPIGGMVHSFAFNNEVGDYGATLILQHQLDTISFNTLYGHLSLNDIQTLSEGHYINRGNLIGHFGNKNENGNWPPHLHFQIIEDLQLKEGDYPGVCTLKEREQFLDNCPDPDLILNLLKYTR